LYIQLGIATLFHLLGSRCKQ